MIRVIGLDFLEAVDALRPEIEASLGLEPGIGQVLTSDALDMILDRCDDPAHAREPLAQAVYDFIVARDAKIVVPRE
jgi:hypothetical protein